MGENFTQYITSKLSFDQLTEFQYSRYYLLQMNQYLQISIESIIQDPDQKFYSYSEHIITELRHISWVRVCDDDPLKKYIQLDYEECRRSLVVNNAVDIQTLLSMLDTETKNEISHKIWNKNILVTFQDDSSCKKALQIIESRYKFLNPRLLRTCIYEILTGEMLESQQSFSEKQSLRPKFNSSTLTIRYGILQLNEAFNYNHHYFPFMIQPIIPYYPMMNLQNNQFEANNTQIHPQNQIRNPSTNSQNQRQYQKQNHHYSSNNHQERSSENYSYQGHNKKQNHKRHDYGQNLDSQNERRAKNSNNYYYNNNHSQNDQNYGNFQGANFSQGPENNPTSTRNKDRIQNNQNQTQYFEILTDYKYSDFLKNDESRLKLQKKPKKLRLKEENQSSNNGLNNQPLRLSDSNSNNNQQNAAFKEIFDQESHKIQESVNKGGKEKMRAKLVRIDVKEVSKSNHINQAKNYGGNHNQNFGYQEPFFNEKAPKDHDEGNRKQKYRYTYQEIDKLRNHMRDQNLLKQKNQNLTELFHQQEVKI